MLANPAADKTFRNISDDFKNNLSIVKVDEKQLKKFLASRYHSRLATKMCALFSWSSTRMDFKDYSGDL